MLTGKDQPAVLYKPSRLVVCSVSRSWLLHGAVEGGIAIARTPCRHLIMLRMLSSWAGLCESEMD